YENHVSYENQKSYDIKQATLNNLSLKQGENFMSLYPSNKSHLQLLSTIKEKTTLRSLQKFMQHAKKCAMSLGGSELVFLSNQNSSSLINKKLLKNKMSKTDLIKKENETRLQKIKTEKDKQFLKSYLSKYLRSNDTQKKYFLESIYLDNYSMLIKKRITLLRIEYYNSIWKYESRKERPDDSQMVNLYTNCLYFLEECILESTKQEKEYVHNIMKEIGFSATLSELMTKNKDNKEDYKDDYKGDEKSKDYKDDKDKDYKDDDKSKDDEKSKDYKDKEDEIFKVSDVDVYFQLKHAGDRLKRSLFSVKDSRTSFLLDAWQKKTLDLIDQNQSLIISAPTSSGKTFITYYTINRAIIQYNNILTGVSSYKKSKNIQNIRKKVLFVVPEKALVNQLAFDIINKFDNLKYGMILKEYSHDEDADVILTVPEMVEGILSKFKNGKNENNTIKRNEDKNENSNSIKRNENKNENNTIKRNENKNENSNINTRNENNSINEIILIIDEIHKLNSPEMSSFIERSIHKHSGQLICLSATMGEDKKIYQWLKSIKNDIQLVEHEERYCELRKWYFSKKMTNGSECIGLISPMIHIRPSDFYKTENNSDISDSERNSETMKYGDDNLETMKYGDKNSEKNKDRNLEKKHEERNLEKKHEEKHSNNNSDKTNPKDIPYALKAITLLPEEVLSLYYAIFTVLQSENIENVKNLKKDVKALKFSKWFKSNIVTKMDVRLYYFDLIRVIIRNNIANEVLKIMNKETLAMFSADFYDEKSFYN
ncbi:putative helicase, DEAD-box superfamily, partial [Pseudoloma neurophilia]